MEEDVDDGEFTCRVIVTEAFFAVGMFRCTWDGGFGSSPSLRFLDRVNGPPFLAAVVVNGFVSVMSMLLLSMEFLEIRIFSNWFCSVDDDDFDSLDVKSTGEQDGGCVVIAFGPATSVANDEGGEFLRFSA